MGAERLSVSEVAASVASIAEARGFRRIELSASTSSSGLCRWVRCRVDDHGGCTLHDQITAFADGQLTYVLADRTILRSWHRCRDSSSLARAVAAVLDLTRTSRFEELPGSFSTRRTDRDP